MSDIFNLGSCFLEAPSTAGLSAMDRSRIVYLYRRTWSVELPYVLHVRVTPGGSRSDVRERNLERNIPNRFKSTLCTNAILLYGIRCAMRAVRR